MKKILIITSMGISMLIFAGCGDTSKPSLSGNGVEDIQVEEIRVEEIRVEEIRIESWENSSNITRWE